MIAEAIHTKLSTLSIEDKKDLIALLKKDLQPHKSKDVKMLSEKEIRRNNRMEWLKKHVLKFPPKS